MKITIKTNRRILKGVERFGNDYRHCYNRKHYFIMSAKSVDKNHVEFLLREV